MKIGILTFHSQLNYGGVLQAYALQQAISHMGHEAVIVDRWLSENNQALTDSFSRRSILGKCRRFLYAILGSGVGGEMLRRKRTQRFIKDNLALTPFHFLNWHNAPSELANFDCFIVGSDQVWNVQSSENYFYLLEEAPNIPKVSYAASMGGTCHLPNNDLTRFKKALDGFSAISVREKTAREFINALGLPVEHVVDPTLLAPKECWINFRHIRSSNRRCFCYFMEDNLPMILPELQNYLLYTGGVCDIFFNDVSQFSVNLPTDVKSLKAWYFLQQAKLKKRIHLHFGAGPAEFVKYASMATDAISDSFHALMFSIIFDLNVRILAPKNEFRTQMFSRIREIENYILSGNLVVNNLHEAVNSLVHSQRIQYDMQLIEERRNESEHWIINALKSVEECRGRQ